MVCRERGRRMRVVRFRTSVVLVLEGRDLVVSKLYMLRLWKAWLLARCKPTNPNNRFESFENCWGTVACIPKIHPESSWKIEMQNMGRTQVDPSADVGSAVAFLFSLTKHFRAQVDPSAGLADGCCRRFLVQQILQT